MDRRTFCGLTAGALFGSEIQANESAAQDGATKLKFTQEQTGDGPFRADTGGTRPHILVISADMVGPDLYHPARALSQHVQIPHIRSLMQEGRLLLQRILHRAALLAFASLLSHRTI